MLHTVDRELYIMNSSISWFFLYFLFYRCAVDRHPTDVNINLTILCSDSNAKNRSSARILQIIKGKDYGKCHPGYTYWKQSVSMPME